MSANGNIRGIPGQEHCLHRTTAQEDYEPMVVANVKLSYTLTCLLKNLKPISEKSRGLRFHNPKLFALFSGG